jgi:hypothetical protein
MLFPPLPDTPFIPVPAYRRQAQDGVFRCDLNKENIPARGIEGVNGQKNSNGQKFPIEPKIRERVRKL